jgi:hypothetical protein
MNAGEIRYSVHSPTLSNLVTLKSFHYFKLYISNVSDFFQCQLPWNHQYSAAQKIYGSGPGCLALRAAIRAEHSILYSNRENRSGTKKGAIPNTPQAFFNLLHEFQDFGLIEPKETLQVYTYVLMPDSLRFSRTSDNFNVDFLSKHALHAGASPTVVYAGEFWIQESEGNPVLYIDNNSGTFAPPKAGLESMKALLQNMFSGLEVIVLDYQDPLWTTIRKNTPTNV